MFVLHAGVFIRLDVVVNLHGAISPIVGCVRSRSQGAAIEINFFVAKELLGQVSDGYAVVVEA